MAVVQISKIQLRRGRKNGEAGIPQLSSGEMAWAVDTQELYIGNGAVAEGSPEVGNTKVLTEHDNLLDLIESYRFGRNDPSITTSVFRTLQDKLDDRVNVKDFGAVGDGVVDDTQSFQNALNELFRNVNPEFRKQLFVPTGHYKIAGTLYIPSYTLIEGESQVGAIILVNSSSIRVTSSNGTDQSLFESTDRPKNINIERLTFRFTTGHFDITGLSESQFKNVTFEGPYTSVADVSIAPLTDAMIFMSNTNKSGTVVDNVNFDGCRFQGAYRGINFTQTNPYETRIKIVNTTFKTLKYGMEINGVAGQKNTWYINDCHFEEVVHRAVQSDYGTGMKIQRTRFVNCGNDINQNIDPESSIIVFGEYGNNIVESCSFDRHNTAYTTVLIDDTRVHQPEVLNGASVTINDQIMQDLFVSLSFTPMTMFSTLNKKTVLNYIVDFANGSARSGQLSVTLGDSLQNPIITDTYSGTCGDAAVETLEFAVRLVDRSDSSLGTDTMIIDYKNPNAGVTPDNISYFVSYGV
jgi:hypothetical protein